MDDDTKRSVRSNEEFCGQEDSAQAAPDTEGSRPLPPETRYRDIVENAASIIMCMDWRGHITYVSPFTSAFLGSSHDELLGNSVVGAIVPDTEPNWQSLRQILKTLEERHPAHLSLEGAATRHDGRPVWIQWALQPIGDEILCVGSDITVRKEAERLAHIERDLAVSLSTATTRDQVLHIGLDAALAVSGMVGGGVYLLSPSQENSELVCHQGLLYEQLQAVSFGGASAPSSQFLESGEPFYGSPRAFGCAQDHLASTVRVLAFVPIRHKAKTAGALCLVSCTIEDVTPFTKEALDTVTTQIGSALARIQTESALQESDRRYRTLFETANDIVYTHDTEGRLTSLNRAGERITGYTIDEAHGTNVLTVVAPEEQTRVREMIGQKLFRPVPTVYELDIITRDGRRLPLEVSSQVITQDGKAVGVQGIARDITKRKRAEDALRASEEKYRNILENIEEGYYEMDLEGTLTFQNDSLCRIMGYSREELINHDTRRYYADEAAYARACKTFDEVYRTGTPKYETEWMVVTRDGTGRNLELSISLKRDDDGAPAGFRGIARDVTDRIQAEEEHRQLEARIQHAQKLESLGVLAGGIAHDFNNLLVGIMGNAGLALMRLPADSPLLTNIERIEASAKRAADLTTQMLAYSGKGTFVVRSLNLSKIAEEIATLLQASVSKNGVLRFDFTENIPEVLGDPGQIQQVIMNLITNASDALEDKHGMISIRTGTVEADSTFLSTTYFHDDLAEGCYVFVEVSDTGCGMDEETRTRIFDPFFTTKFAGRGLGLAATLGIVRSHQGTIKVYSELSHGTTIKVFFPAPGVASDRPSDREGDSKAEPLRLSAEYQSSGAIAAPSLGDTRESTDAASAGSDGHGDGLILIMDDEESVREIGKEVLEASGFEVLTAEDGGQGVDLYRKHISRVALVIIDLTMPVLDGERAFQEIEAFADSGGGRQDGTHVPVILSSGYNEEEATHRFAGRRLAGFIQKPYPPQDLVVKVREALDEVRRTS